MKHIVHIYGPCGSGTSTLGREIGRRLGFRFLQYNQMVLDAE